MVDKNRWFSYGKSFGEQINSDSSVTRERREFIKAGLVVTASTVLPCFATGAIGST
ncbi:MAG: hypothetical protein ACSLEN_08075 [Candidatus Malihini olakiniferum]